ncbi:MULTISPECIES: hypothetical protein [Streptomyces]|uniref:Uncharacterized protein n=1 Tax=Streptomyces pini TaxID=1520580 RepID=A0A1I4DLD5_9ACTN|nr:MULTISPECIES: hypothetical protein [Streptomyces]SFK92721.1 hypothetical protein SAMN05192584_110112 [Streptomyces pini]
MRSATTIRRAALVAAAMASIGLINAPSASANWSSYISSWTDGEESRRWEDQGTYSQVQFRDCFAQNAGSSNQKVTLTERVDISFSPDKVLDSKTFSNCFKGSSYWSNGEWTDVPSGTNTLYFRADKIGQGGSCCLLFVSEVYVDTSKAD